MALTKIIGAGIGTVTNQFADANMASGSVLQVVTVHNSTEVETTNADNYVDTGVTATITPTSSSSKILVTTTIQQFITGSAGSTATRLLRGSTVIKDFGFQGYGTSIMFTSTNQYLDSPSTTSSTTYKHQFKTNGIRTICQYQGSFGSTSTITLQEIAQ